MADHINEYELLQLIKRLDLNNAVDEIENLIDPVASQSNKQNGWVKIENNKIIVHNPNESGMGPSIRYLDPLIIKKNNKPLLQNDIVDASDKITWEITAKQLFRIQVTEDKMEAYLQVISKDQYAWNLKDIPESTHIMIEAVEDKDVLLNSLRLTDVMQELQRMNIHKNIKTSEIFMEIQNPTFEPILIASGIHPVNGEDAQLQLFFHEEIESRFAEMDGTIDYRNHLKIPTAKKDEVIALKIPGKPGVIGYNVYGEIVFPKEPMDITIAAKDHVMIIDDCKVIALKEGRPRVTGTVVRYFDITTSYIVTGDVNIETGNIVFSGDIIVYGNVTENMTLESLGNIYVMGNVYKATITATGGIKVKGNIIASHLYSGYFGVIFNRLYMNTKLLSEQLLSLVNACKMMINILEGRKQNYLFSNLLTTLIETKFQELPKKSKEIIYNIENIQSISAGELNELKEKLKILTNPTFYHFIKSFDTLSSINNLVSDVFQMIERMQETDAHVDISQCHLTSIKSNGDTYIRKEGILQSDIYSKGNVIFFESDSVCRGGKIDCGGIISAMIVGGEVGGETYLKAGSKIMIKRMTSGKVCVDRYTKDILSPITNVTFEVVDKRLAVQQNDTL